MKRILFVDDEPKVLGGLRRMLRALRHEWDLDFVESGPEALMRLAASPFDVVVTDMRMPGMDGAQLLSEVAKHYPATVRIVLSGQCQREAVLKCAGPAHQFLTKPCDPDTLKSTVGRACRLRDHLPCEWIRQVVSCIESLPSRAAAHAGLVAELERSEPSIQRVGEIASQDVGMSAKIMQLVSSGFFGTPQRVSGVAHAVNLLGLDTIRALALSSDVFLFSGTCHSQEQLLETLTEHSLAVALAAKKIAQSESDDARLIDDSFIAGMLHDVGVLVLSKNSPEHYLEAIALAGSEQITIKEAEKRCFDTTRDDVGAYLMGLWGLPDPIVRAVAHHLSPGDSPEHAFGPLTAVHAANAILEEEHPDAVGPATPLDTAYLEEVGCADRLPSWREACRQVSPQGVTP